MQIEWTPRIFVEVGDRLSRSSSISCDEGSLNVISSVLMAKTSRLSLVGPLNSSGGQGCETESRSPQTYNWNLLSTSIVDLLDSFWLDVVQAESNFRAA